MLTVPEGAGGNPADDTSGAAVADGCAKVVVVGSEEDVVGTVVIGTVVVGTVIVGTVVDVVGTVVVVVDVVAVVDVVEVEDVVEVTDTAGPTTRLTVMVAPV